MSNSKKINTLDEIRIENGIVKLKNHFQSLVKNNSKEAVNYLNDDHLQYVTLFELRNEIEEFNILTELNTRNRIALRITKEILSKESNNLIAEYLSSHHISKVCLILKWILETGFAENTVNNELDKTIDTAAVLLTKVYRDKSILPTIVNIIFNRFEKDYFIHDLVWAFFESQDPYTLFLIGNRLKSNKKRDVQLARKLLSFVPGINVDSDIYDEKQYLSFLKWFEENNLFLYYGGESLQETKNPIPFKIDLSGKYLCKVVSNETGEILIPLTPQESKLLKQFNELDENSRILLSNFSSIMRQSSMYWWNVWINYPILEQIRTAKTRMGGYYD